MIQYGIGKVESDLCCVESDIVWELNGKDVEGLDIFDLVACIWCRTICAAYRRLWEIDMF